MLQLRKNPTALATRLVDWMTGCNRVSCSVFEAHALLCDLTASKCSWNITNPLSIFVLFVDLDQDYFAHRCLIL